MKKWTLFVVGVFCASLVMGQGAALAVPETQTALITKRTATWCTICGGFAWDMMKRLQADYDSSQAVSLNVHHSSGSRLHSNVAEAWIDAFESSFSQPRFYAGTEELGSGNAGTEAAIREHINEQNAVNPVAQSALAVAYEPETRSLRVEARMTFFQDGDAGTYRLGLYLVERTVMEEQANRGANVEHNNVLREVLTDNPFGIVLHQGAFTAGQSYNTQEFFALSEAYDIDNLMFLGVIWQGDAESLTYVNAAATTSYNLMQANSTREQTLAGTFGIVGNPVGEILHVRMELQVNEPALHWQIIDLQGKVWKQGQASNLPVGEQMLSLLCVDLPAGLFYVQLRNRVGQRATLPFVKKE